MDAYQFVASWKAEKELYMASLLENGSLAGEQIRGLALSPEQEVKLWAALNTVLTDVFYTLLLGLDGSAQIGGVQETFKIRDEAGNLISDCGELEAEAYAQFHTDA